MLRTVYSKIHYSVTEFLNLFYVQYLQYFTSNKVNNDAKQYLQH